jgi:hypothetical protein
MSSVSEQSGAALLELVVRVGSQLHDSARIRLADSGRITDDPRWADSGCPFPLGFDYQLHVLFLGALDSYEVGAGLMRRRASQQVFSTIRFQNETLCLVRWLTEPDDPTERRHRAYRLLNGQLRSLVFMFEEDLRSDVPEEVENVQKARGWLTELHRIGLEDGVDPLAEDPNRQTLFNSYFSPVGYPAFRMQSEIGSHPNLMGNRLFASISESGVVDLGLNASWDERAFWAGTAGMTLALTCQAVAGTVGWDDWFRNEARPLIEKQAPLLEEALRRRQNPGT